MTSSTVYPRNSSTGPKNFMAWCRSVTVMETWLIEP